MWRTKTEILKKKLEMQNSEKKKSVIESNDS